MREIPGGTRARQRPAQLTCPNTDTDHSDQRVPVLFAPLFLEGRDGPERERTWALVSARAEGISIRALATAIGLSPSRMHQIVTDAGLDAALGGLRAGPVAPLRRFDGTSSRSR